MTDNRFKEGEEVQALYFQDEQIIRVGVRNTTKIVVVMENGQMAGVPWFAVFEGDKLTTKYNGALLEGVELY